METLTYKNITMQGFYYLKNSVLMKRLIIWIILWNSRWRSKNISNFIWAGNTSSQAYF